MSLCLALLLAVIAIDWWQGWKPFTHPFQMPGNQWLKRLSTIRSQRRRSSLCPGSIVDANCRELGLQGRVREGVSTFDLADDAVNSERMVDISYGWLTGSD